MQTGGWDEQKGWVSLLRMLEALHTFNLFLRTLGILYAFTLFLKTLEAQHIPEIGDWKGEHYGVRKKLDERETPKNLQQWIARIS